MSEFKITEEKENPLFNRKEIKGFVESEVVPSRAETLEILSKKFNIPLGNIKIKKILGKFGSKTFNIEANIYSSEKDKDSIELKKKKEKSPEEKVEEAPKEKPEVQPEPPKEEPKPEEKTE
jgi:ribosomal protein S24E